MQQAIGDRPILPGVMGARRGEQLLNGRDRGWCIHFVSPWSWRGFNVTVGKFIRAHVKNWFGCRSAILLANLLATIWQHLSGDIGLALPSKRGNLWPPFKNTADQGSLSKKR